MRILLLQETNWIERGPHQQHHLMDRMSLKGHEIRVIDYNLQWKEEKDRRIFKPREELGKQPKIFPNAKVDLVRPGIIQIPFLDYLSIPFSHHGEISRQIKEFKPDVILSFGVLNAYIGVKLAKKHKIPHVYYLIDHLHTLLPLKMAQPVAKYLESRTIKCSDKILVINKGLADYAVEMGGSAEKISVISGGVDLKRYTENLKKRKEIRKRYGIKDSDTVLFFMGYLYNFSGLKEVALELMKMEDKKNKLMVVGEGDQYNELKSIKGNSDQIILTGKQNFDRIPELLSAADICLLPAYNISIMQNIVPIKMYEYMAMGKPVIATKLPGIMKEFGSDNGVIYVDGPENVFEKAQELSENNLINIEGEKGQKFASACDWDKIGEEFECALKDIIKRN
jgi:glycosyltransferase involved in cell wall biosynthesis